MKKENVTTNKVTRKLEKVLHGFDPDVYHISDRNVFRTVYEW